MGACAGFFLFFLLKNKQLNSLATKIKQNIVNCIKPAAAYEIQTFTLVLNYVEKIQSLTSMFSLCLVLFCKCSWLIFQFSHLC